LPTPRPRAPTAAQQREARLAAALRENLRRRKAQTRGRADETQGEAQAEDPPAKPAPQGN
ncbi:hypothetical protein, partial [Roseomonas sp. 18066]|uniref:hypothetical protein n=1 Tax=Roseomonas sp. 18066 TaxID=2681412 RepID=UPI001358A5AA